MMLRTGRMEKEVRSSVVYMEIFGENKVAYRVTSGRINFKGRSIDTYGIEAEDYISGEKEVIPDFSKNVKDAVEFAEQLIKGKVTPKQMYCKALRYLCVSI